MSNFKHSHVRLFLKYSENCNSLSCEMPKLFAPGFEERVLKPSDMGMSKKAILRELKKSNFLICYNSICNIILSKGIRRNAIQNREIIPKKRHPRKVLKKDVLKKLKLLSSVKNPISQISMAN